MQLLCLLLGLVICSYGVKSSEEDEIKDFDGIDGPDGTLSEADNPMDQMQDLQIAGLGTENNEAIDEDEILSGLSNPKRSGLFLRASRAAGSGLYFRSSRGDPEMIPLSLRNGMLLRSFKRSLNLIHKKSGNGLFLRASKGGLRYSKPVVPMNSGF